MDLEEIKNYLRVDGSDEDVYITELIETSRIYIDSTVGEGYKEDNKLSKLSNLLQKKLIADMYENRSTYVDESKRDIIATTILDKLSMVGD